MSYTATAVKVMIASPGDVASERQVIRQVIEEWNAIHAEDRRQVLMPIGWETHASPAVGDHPQSIINSQLKECDLLVAVFWTRLGSPTGRAPSGTVEEINEHLAAGKRAMIYFSATPVRLDSVDNEEYQRLLEFKKDVYPRALVGEYESLGDFRDLFKRHLAHTIIRDFPRDVAGSELPLPPPIPPPDAAEVLRKMVSDMSISDEARTLLLEAAQDDQGVVMNLVTMDGSDVQTNRREFITTQDPRTVARWRSAVQELERFGLLEDRRGSGELFFVTDAGYGIARALSAG